MVVGVMATVAYARMSHMLPTVAMRAVPFTNTMGFLLRILIMPLVRCARSVGSVRAGGVMHMVAWLRLYSVQRHGARVRKWT